MVAQILFSTFRINSALLGVMWLAFFLIVPSVIIVTIFLVHALAGFLGFKVKYFSLILCAFMSFAVNAAAIKISIFLDRQHYITLGVLVLIASIIVTVVNRILLKKDESAAKISSDIEDELALAEAEAEYHPKIDDLIIKTDESKTFSESKSPLEIADKTLEVKKTASTKNIEKSNVKTTDKPTEIKVDKSTANKVTTSKVEKSANVSVDNSANSKIDKSTSINVDKSANAKMDKSTSINVDKAVNAKADKISTGKVNTKVEIKAEDKQTDAQKVFSAKSDKPKEVKKSTSNSEVNKDDRNAPKSKDETASSINKPATSVKSTSKTNNKTDKPVSEPKTEPKKKVIVDKVELVNEHLESLDDILDYAYAQKTSGDLSQAILAYQKALDRYKNDDYAPFIAIDLGNIYKEQAAYSKVIKTYEEALKLPVVLRNADTRREFTKNLDYIRIVQSVLLRHRALTMPFSKIPIQYLQEIETEFKAAQFNESTTRRKFK